MIKETRLWKSCDKSYLSLMVHGLRKTILCLQEWRFGCSRSSKVIDFGTNRKHVCDFQLVRDSNLGPILHRFGDTAGFLCSWPHPYSILI